MSILFMIFDKLSLFIAAFCLLFLVLFFKTIFKTFNNNGKIKEALHSYSIITHFDFPLKRKPAIVLLLFALVFSFLSNAGIQQLVHLDRIDVKPYGSYYACKVKFNGEICPAVIKIDLDSGHRIYNLKKVALNNGEKTIEFEEGISLVVCNEVIYDDYKNNNMYSCYLFNECIVTPVFKNINNINCKNILLLLFKWFLYFLVLIPMLKKYDKDEEEKHFKAKYSVQ